MVEENRQISARAIYIEVQHRYLGNDNKMHYIYNGGVAFSIGPHHLITALHVVKPEERFLHDWKDGTLCYNKILELDPLFTVEENESPHNSARWKDEDGEYRILHLLPEFDVALLHTEKTHFVTPVSVQPLTRGISRIYTLDLRNYFCQQIHTGRCWSAEESSGTYYLFDAIAEQGFSGGPVLGNLPNCFSC